VNNKTAKCRQPVARSANAIVADIRKFCKENGNPAMVKKYSRFFKEGYDAYGLNDQAYNKCEELICKDGDLSLKTVLDIAPPLLESGKYEEAFFAIRFIKPHIAEFDADTFKRLEKWFDYGVVNWAHSDVLSGSIFSVFLTQGIVPLKSFESWRTAANKFQRRSSAVTLIEYLKFEKNIKPMLVFIEPMMMDEAREVHQGVGWFLREAWKIRKAETEKFLLKWKDKAPRLIFQYACEKMTAEEKKRFKREK
jgi:3-methyladenine DNA glycosylase AlkD